MKKRLNLILSSLFLCVGMALAQTTANGVVVSAEDGEPIVGATVKVVGTNTGAVTNIDGQFSVSVPGKNSKLEVSFVGYTTQTVAAGRNLTISLESDTENLDEVMVVAFGTEKKSAFTGSAKVVGSEELALSQVSSATNALAGAVAGVQLVSSNGAPGSTSTIRIRGFSSINAGKDPLIVLDGAPYEGDMSNINPNDIESMTVLKDAASNALYGARGANGVIMITTKKAKAGEAVVTFDAKLGGNTRALQHYNVIKNPAQYYEMHYGALYDYYMNQGSNAYDAWARANSNLCGDQGNGGLGYNVYSVPAGQVLIGQNGKLNPNATLGNIINYKGEDFLITPDNWEDAGTRTGLRQEYNASVSSSSSRGTFYASLGYLSNEGITEASDMQRFTGRLKADYEVKKWLKVGANMTYTRFNSNSLSNNGSSSSTGNIWAFTSQMAPIYPMYVRNADGSIKVDGNGIQVMDYGDGANAGLGRPFLSDANPIQDSYLNTRNAEGHAFNATGYADFRLMKGLTLTVNGTATVDDTRYNYVYNPYYGQFDSTGGSVTVQNSRMFNHNTQQLLNYATTIADDHNLTVMVGHEYTKNRNYYLYASKSMMFNQENKELNGAVVDGQASGSYKTTYNNEGWFGRAQYDYDSRIFASASLRRDASSKFAPEHRWGTFWSLGAAWILSNEQWFKSSWVDMLKVKASIGSQGNDNISSYLYTDTYSVANSGGNVGVSFNTKGSEDITWETKTNSNVGVEFELLKRISGSLEYFYGKTSDMLFSFSVAPSNGYAYYYDNVGDLYNSGFELDLNINIFNKKNFQWDFNINATTLRNRITKLDAAKKTTTVYDSKGKEYQGYKSGNFFIAEGTSMYSWYLREFAGVYNENTYALTGDAEYDASKGGLSMWYMDSEDADGNRTRKATTSYSDADYYLTGNSTIPKVYGGFGTKLKFYGFDFAVNFSYQLGGKGYDYTYATFMSSPTGSSTGYNFHADLLKAWTTDNSNSVIPRFMYADTYSGGTSTRFLTSASYLNIENINFGYTLPSRITRKAMINSLRLYVAAENVFYWSARRGFDPRQTFGDVVDGTNYSPMRTISGGITLTF